MLYLPALYFKSSCLIVSSYFLIISISFLILTVLIFFGKSPSIDSSSSSVKALKTSTYFFLVFCSSIAFVCLSKAFPNGEYANLASLIIILWSGGNIFSPVRYSYLSIFPDDNADIFAASLLI